jgi:DNA-binding response OmpR family regulator
MVDDVAEIRELIKRMLTAEGHVVDAVATAEEASALEPSDYDVLLIDAQLRQGSGTAFIDSLVARDPALARKCVLITGGAVGSLSEGVRVLRKPFDRRALLDTLRATNEPGSEADRDQSGHALAGQSRVIELLDQLRGYDYGMLRKLVHDGPVQDLSAAILALDLTRRRVPDEVARQLDEVATWLARAAATLSDLTDRPRAPGPGQAALADAVRQQSASAGVQAITVRAIDKAGPLEPAEQRAVATIVGMLLDTVRLRPVAEVEVTSDERFLTIALTVHTESPDETVSADLATLDRLAWAFGGHARTGTAGTWTVKIVLDRLPSAAPC